MLYCVGTVDEIMTVQDKFPKAVIEKLHHCTSVLDEAYGEERNYWQTGGYSLLAQNETDLTGIRMYIREDHPCEWADRLDGDYLSALYLLNDNFSIVVFMPISIAPPDLLSELED